MQWEKILTKKKRESSDPYYDLNEDFDLIVASFQSQYGIRLSKELRSMKWREFKAFIVGFDHKTPLGRIVSIRAEDDPDVLKEFSKDEHRIRNEWRRKVARQMPQEKVDDFLENMKQAFINMAGEGSNGKNQM